MLKVFVKKLDEVDEKFRELYEKTEGGFMLTTDDSDFKTKIGEFRGNNIELKKKIEHLENTVKEFDGIDPKKVREAQKKLQEIEDGKLLEEGKVEELVNQRIDRMSNEYKNQINTLSARAETAEKIASTYKNQLTNIAVDNGISKAISEVATPRKGALTDILGRAKQIWTAGEDGQLVAKDSSGNIIYGKEGKNPLSPQEYITSLSQEAPFLFEQSSGGGASGSQKQPSHDGSKVIARDDKEAFANNLEAIAKGTMIVK